MATDQSAPPQPRQQEPRAQAEQHPEAPTHTQPRIAALGNTPGTAAFVFGLLATIMALIPVAGFFLAPLFGITGIIVGSFHQERIRKGEASNPAITKAGIVLGGTSIVLMFVMTVTYASIFGWTEL
jgi:hypothetical protein